MNNKNHNILLFGKNRTITIQIHAYLEAAGYHAVIAQNESEIIACQDTIDLIILNASPPYINCLPVCLKIKGLPEIESIPIMLISESISEDEIFKLYQQGVDDFISEPVQRSEFLAHVYSLIRMKTRCTALRHEIQTMKKSQERLQELVIRDDLTGLYNHRYLHNLLPHEIARSERLGYVFSLVLIDIDHFKEYNDTFGHLNGDIVLHEFAAALQSNIRSGDIVVRYGGDEFVLILLGTDRHQAEKITNELRLIIENKKFPSEADLLNGCITLSAGIAVCPSQANTADRLLEFADRALYTAKRHGRNCIAIAEDAA